MNSQTVYPWNDGKHKNEKESPPPPVPPTVSLTRNPFPGKNVTAVDVTCLIVLWILSQIRAWKSEQYSISPLCSPWVLNLASSLCGGRTPGGKCPRQGLLGPHGGCRWSSGLHRSLTAFQMWSENSWMSQEWRSNLFVGQFSGEPAFENLREMTNPINVISVFGSNQGPLKPILVLFFFSEKF